MGARNRVRIGLSYQPARLGIDSRLLKKVYKYGLWDDCFHFQGAQESTPPACVACGIFEQSVEARNRVE
jgi:hypothetical protein